MSEICIVITSAHEPGQRTMLANATAMPAFDAARNRGDNYIATSAALTLILYLARSLLLGTTGQPA